VEPLLAQGYAIFSFDGPAHGASSGTSTDILKYSKITQKIIQQFGPIHAVITHSFGAMVFSHAYEPAMNLKKAVFICPPSGIQTPIKHFQKTLHIPLKVMKHFTSLLKLNYGEDIYHKVNVLDNTKKIQI